jgi:hypothetical protein
LFEPGDVLQKGFGGVDPDAEPLGQHAESLVNL